MIGRRVCVLGALAVGFLCPVHSVGAAEPVSTAKVYRIGVLDLEPEAHIHLWHEFVAELARIGYVEGRNLRFDRRVVRSGDADQLAKAAAELVATRVDLLFAARGTESALAAKRATTSIPVVFYSSADPIGTGLVASFPRPGGNVTGSSTSSADIAAKNLEFLAEVLGRRRLRVVQIQPRGTQSSPWFSTVETSIAATASRLGARYEYVEVDTIAEIDPLLKRLAREGIDAVTFESFAMDEQQGRRIADQLIELRLASIGSPSEGFLFTYEPDWLQLARIAAQNVDKILSGTAPAQLPVQQPSIFDLSINLRTAKALGLSIPKSILLRANDVIR